MNTHYKNRYDRFISKIKNYGNRTIEGYVEKHHIQPKCLKGSDDPENIVTLTLREHFIAHWILWKVYPDYLPLASAFLQMVEKNPKTEKITGWKISSRTYEALRIAVYELISNFNTDKVYVKDENGNSLCLSSEEYKQSNYKFHTTGKVAVKKITTNEICYITKEEYRSNKDIYVSLMKCRSDVGSVLYNFIDLETKELIKVSKKEARKRNKEFGYKRLKQVISHNYRCIGDNGEYYVVSAQNYDPKKNQHHRVGLTTAYDLVNKKHVSILLEEYYNEPLRYLTTTKGMVLAKDRNGQSVFITKKEFENGEYQGQTKGLRTVFDKSKMSYVQISEDLFLKNKNNYQGPNIGKVNVIDMSTGERKQIPKEQFDKTVFMGLGNKDQYFLSKHLLTRIEKNISIYEWNIAKDKYEILDMTAFQKAQKLL